jgi:hypothetical protein
MRGYSRIYARLQQKVHQLDEIAVPALLLYAADGG